MNRRQLLGGGAMAAAGLWASSVAAEVTGAPPVKALRITVLSTMLAEEGIGEWGYSALVEVDGQRFLFDTGAHPDVVLKNAEDMKIDLSTVEAGVITHNHGDHTGGLVTLRTALMKRNPKALSTIHVGAGAFVPRLTRSGVDRNGLTALRGPYEATRGRFVQHAKPDPLAPGVWITGPVPRANDERNWNPGLFLPGPDGKPGAADTVAEDSSLIFDTPKGLVILTGCGHAGVVNIAEYARQVVRPAPIEALIGGIHLYTAPDARVDWTAAKLKAMGVKHLLAGHCTGIEATYRLRSGLGLTRATAVVSAVGSAYDLDKGILAGQLAA